MAVSIKIHGFLDAFANVTLTLTTNLLNFLKMHLGGNRIAVLQNSIKIMRSKKGGKKKKCFATFAERKKNRICIGTLFPK